MKNTGPSYTLVWVKDDNDRFPRQLMASGQRSHALSPHSQSTLQADRTEFAALLQHLRKTDHPHTVIMIQVENEVGTWGNDRDHAPAADALFQGQVPADLVAHLGKSPGAWSEVFGADAATFFNGWHIARFVDQVAAAGKAEYPLPMYVNAITAHASGAPTPPLLDMWRFAAPTIDFVGPDLYERKYEVMTGAFTNYARANNALFIAEIGNHPTNARYLFDVLGRRGIGFQPFGVDFTGYSNYPLGAERLWLALDRTNIWWQGGTSGSRSMSATPSRPPGRKFQFLQVEEGHFDEGKWVRERLWNGDQTDYGLNFRKLNQLMRVRLGTY